MVIFEKSQQDRKALAQMVEHGEMAVAIPENMRRQSKALLPECSEMDVVRHYSLLSRKNFSIDTNFYPLGSCTMKHNPRGVHKAANHQAFLNRHPLLPSASSQGFLSCMYALQEYLKDITGMTGVSLTPMAGAQGEFAGVAMIKSYHQARGDTERTEMLIPDAAHGTNPASAIMCGFDVKEIPTSGDGEIDLDALEKALGPKTAGIMLTNPSTLGIFERDIENVAAMVHQAGGLLYYDGANLNAILGKVKPGDMGFDVMHLNLHKTFATPHGGGGPGAGPVAVNDKLKPYLPMPTVIKEGDAYRYATRKDFPQSIGRLSAFMGNAGILLRAYFYILVLGREGLHRVSEFATLNANYLMHELKKAGFEMAYPERRASHEFILTFKNEKKTYQVTAMDVAKRLLDFGVHAPTTYFPLLVPECFLIEPTETESKKTLDHFIGLMKTIRQEIIDAPQSLKKAPTTLPVKRLDEVKAARELDLTWQQKQEG
jgi:glycine dehydrogenase subunit 2